MRSPTSRTAGFCPLCCAAWRWDRAANLLSALHFYKSFTAGLRPQVEVTGMGRCRVGMVQPMFRFHLFGGTIAVAGVLAVGWSTAIAQPADGKGKRPVVVELYTSQGCSSCPPADTLLGQLSTRKDVLAISLPVTYWDMLGWRDTLASETNTQRQKAYAKQLGRGGIYTPQ